VAFPVVAMGVEETGGGSDQSGKPVLSPAEVGLTKVEEGVGETEEAFPRGERICGWARVAAPKVVETRCGGAGRADQGRNARWVGQVELTVVEGRGGWHRH
jgi:hypothetical protein